MRAVCPNCGGEFGADTIQASNDMPPCAECGYSAEPGDISMAADAFAGSLNNPPYGVWLEQVDNGWRLGASLQSWMALYFAVFGVLAAVVAVAAIGYQFQRGRIFRILAFTGILSAVGSARLAISSLLCMFGCIFVTVRARRARYSRASAPSDGAAVSRGTTSPMSGLSHLKAPDGLTAFSDRNNLSCSRGADPGSNSARCFPTNGKRIRCDSFAAPCASATWLAARNRRKIISPCDLPKTTRSRIVWGFGAKSVF